MQVSQQLTRTADTFLLVKVKHHSERTLKRADLIAVTSVVRGAMVLRRRVVKLIRVLAQVINTLGIRLIHDDR
jgi:hypothetical protein